MNIVIFGATGMVGGEVLEQCLADDGIRSVLTIGRRKSGARHPKLTEIEHGNFLDFSAVEDELTHVNVCLYCLGVYQAHVSKERFWEVTVDYLKALIDAFERANKDVRFCLFSAHGASTSEKSPIRFAKAKGRAENLLMASDLAEKFIFRPGYILPGPKNKNTTLSARLIEPIFALIPAIGIAAPELARVMVGVAMNRHDLTVFENRDLRAYDGKS